MFVIETRVQCEGCGKNMGYRTRGGPMLQKGMVLEEPSPCCDSDVKVMDVK